MEQEGGKGMTDAELLEELRNRAEVEGAGSTRRLLELAARRIEELGGHSWVRIAERKPREEDADEEGCVMIWHRRTGAQFCAWDMLEESENVRYWCRLPPRPDGEPSPRELAAAELRAMGFGRYGLMNDKEEGNGQASV